MTWIEVIPQLIGGVPKNHPSTNGDPYPTIVHSSGMRITTKGLIPLLMGKPSSLGQLIAR